jgi:hypothetical protein
VQQNRILHVILPAEEKTKLVSQMLQFEVMGTMQNVQNISQKSKILLSLTYHLVAVI